MLPPKIGDGVLGSNSGGVKPTGASVFSSVTAARMVRDVEKVRGRWPVTGKDADGFHGARAWVVDLGGDDCGGAGGLR